MEATSPTFYLRNPAITVIGNKTQLICVHAEEAVFCITKDVLTVGRLMELLREPKSLEDITRSGLCSEQLQAILDILESRKVVLSGSLESLQLTLASYGGPEIGRPIYKRMCVAVCGTVHAAAVLPLVISLRGTVAEQVELVLTSAATRFIQKDVAEYFGLRVWHEEYKTRDGINVPHSFLAAQSEMILVVPASAHTIHRLATGECSDLLSLIVAATPAPVVIAPSMNPRMWNYPPIRRNLDILREAGIYVIEPLPGQIVSELETKAIHFGGPGLTNSNIIKAIHAIKAIHGRSSYEPRKIDS